MLFLYEAKDAEGKEVKGEREAESRVALARILREEGLFVIAVDPADGTRKEKTEALFSRFASLFSHVPLAEKVMFAKNLGVMIGAGLSLPRALAALGNETTHTYFKKVITDLEERTTKGAPLSEALAAHSRVFSDLFSAMVAAGEKSGKLKEAFSILTHQMQNEYQLRKRVRGAFMYPAIIMIAMVGVGILMLMTIVPTLVGTFEELGVDLPASTQAIITVSDFLLAHGIFSFGIVAAIVGGLWRAARYRSVKQWFQFVLFHIPLIRPLIQKINTARAARTLSSLLSAGVQMLEALAITARVLTHYRYRAIFERAQEDIQKGKPMSALLREEESLFPSLFSEMVAVGEETGKLSRMLEEVADFYEGEVAETTKNLSTIIEPILMIVIGAVVGFFAVSMITPLYSVLGNI